MKRKIVLVAVTTVLTSQVALPIVQAASTPVAVVSNSIPVLSSESTKFLNALSKLVTTKSFQSDTAGAILTLSDLLNNGNYEAAYDSLPASEKKILSERYGAASATSFADNVGKAGLSYKFTPVELAK